MQVENNGNYIRVTDGQFLFELYPNGTVYMAENNRMVKIEFEKLAKMIDLTRKELTK